MKKKRSLPTRGSSPGTYHDFIGITIRPQAAGMWYWWGPGIFSGADIPQAERATAPLAESGSVGQGRCNAALGSDSD
jgi:hypothetical protein